MNRIDRLFGELRGEGRKALMPFVTAGDPELATTAELLPVLEQAGASVVELGIPFSDPIADGPVIEASMGRALEAGVRLSDVLSMVREVRPRVGLGLVAMVSYSIVYRHGVARFIAELAEAGLDGLIVPDLSLEEAAPVQRSATEAGLTVSLLIAPTTPIERAKRIAAASTGFVYIVSRSGITGAQQSLPRELPERLNVLRQVTDLPLAVGFGISSPEQVREVVAVADAAIVGSAMVRTIESERGTDRAALVKKVGDLTKRMCDVRGICDV